jgi:hypothetical protein
MQGSGAWWNIPELPGVLAARTAALAVPVNTIGGKRKQWGMKM